MTYELGGMTPDELRESLEDLDYFFLQTVEKVDTEKAWELYAELTDRIGRALETLDNVEEWGERTTDDALELVNVEARKLLHSINTAAKARGKKPEPDYVLWLRANPDWLGRSGAEIAQKLARLGFEPRTPQAINNAKRKIKAESETP